jgi:hypothetical protein
MITKVAIQMRPNSGHCNAESCRNFLVGAAACGESKDLHLTIPPSTATRHSPYHGCLTLLRKAT